MRFARSFGLALIFGGLAGGAGCGDDDNNTGGSAPTGGTTSSGAAEEAGGGGGAGGQGAGAPVVFGACPEGYVDECATLAVPLDHANPGGGTIDLHIARKPASQPAKRQVWLLSGGPGQGGYIWKAYMPYLTKAFPDADIYAIDHRGTGHSHRLTCTGQDTPDSYGGYILEAAAVPACLEELKTKGDYDRLAYFTTAQAARDVMFAVGATRTPGQEVIVYGGSYGTHWAHRVLQVGEADVDKVIFDGYMTPQKFSFTHYDRGVDEVGAVLSAGCAADPECSARMGADPAARARDVWAALDTTPCMGVGGHHARTLASLFVDTGLRNKAFVFPLIHRFERCSPADITAINTLFGQPGLIGSTPVPYLNSGILQYNIVLSELWSLPGERLPTQAELQATAEAQTFLVGGSYPADIVALRDTWPLPPDDYSSLPTPVPTDKPLLWLAGGLDSRTPPAQSQLVTSLYDAPNQPMVFLSTAVHTPGFGSPLASDPTKTCGMTLLPSFVQGSLDTSCLEDLAPIHLHAPNAAFASQWWGDADDWGDASAVAPDTVAVPHHAALPTFPTEMLDPLGVARARRAVEKSALKLRALDRARRAE